MYRYELTSQTVAQTSPGITTYSSNYLIDIVGNSQGKVLIINTSALTGTVLSGQYAWPQVSNGLTRHIVSTSGPLAGPTVSPYLVSGSAAYNIGIAGYTTFNTTLGYSNTEVFSSFLTLGAGLSVVANGTGWYRAAGFNYAEMAYTNSAGGANVYQVYAPQFVPTATDYNNSSAQQTNSPFLLDHYGKLTNGFGVPPINGQAFEIRYNVIDSGGAGLGSPGTQQYLSAAMINGSTDNLGVILTNVGEIDNTYAPHITNDNTILYRYGGNFFIITLGQPTNYIQRITDRLYKINTISPLNNYDDLTNTLQLGSMDYNGRTLITNTAVASGAPYAFDAQILGGFSNSIDMSPGKVLIGSGTIASISGYNIFTPIAYTIPLLTSSLNYGVIEYYGTGSALNYLCTTKNALPLAQTNDTNVVKPLWVSNATYVPTPIGETIYYRAFLQLGYSTLLLNQQYQNPYTGGYNDSDTYIIGNEIYGSFQPFTFYGQDYLFDGSYIWAVLYDSTGTIYQNRFRVQPANGLQFIAVSPIKVYFLSSLDNSLYTFDEGRNLTKEARLNEIDIITNGVYNVHDNSLLLNGATTSGNPNTYGSLIWIRDSVLTINPKTSAQTNLQLFDTTSGIIISNNNSSWQYTFNPLPTSTVVPLTIQTTYMGMEDNEKIKMKNFVATFYNKNAKLKNSKPITISMQSIIREETQVYTSQPQIYTINPGDYNSLGYVMLRLQPQYQTTLGISFIIATQSKINLTNLTVEYVVDGQGMYAGSKSK
jgi:hypothetical protein